MDVLIIEDDADTSANLEDILLLDGHACTSVGTFADALQRLEIATPSVVILDRQLPDGTAEEFIPQIKRLAPEIPMVVVTGYPDIESAIEALRLGAYDYLLKPINPEVLRASVRRIAERLQYVDELREQRDFAERVIQTAQAIVLVLDPRGRIERFNSFMEQLSGYQLEEVQNCDWVTTFGLPEDREQVRQVFETILRNQPVREHVAPIRTKSGEQRIISWSGTPLLSSEGRIVNVLSIGHDITDLRLAQNKLVQNERLAAIGEMVTGLAHESRNAFQRSQACLEMLALDLEEQPESLKLVNKIQNALDHLKFLYEEVRTYAAPINLSRTRLCPDDIIRETWDHLATGSKTQGVTLQVQNRPETPCLILADGHQLQQVFRNLLENAIDACDGSGQIAVTYAVVEHGDHPWARIEIHDNGPGIPLENRAQLFEPFFTTKTRGTGLGMAITRRIVDAHGGSIEVDDSYLGGACFRLYLPCSDAAEVDNPASQLKLREV